MLKLHDDLVDKYEERKIKETSLLKVEDVTNDLNLF